MTKELSILIPVYNSALCLTETVNKVISSISVLNVSYEIILIDDASSDNSWKVVKALKANNENIIGVRFNKNFGQHNALLCGINIANANYIVTIDDDLEQNPEDIITLYNQLKILIKNQILI